MTPSDSIINYNVISFLLLYSDFQNNSLGSISTYYFLLVGTNVSLSASPSSLNCQFVSRPTLLYWEGHDSSIQSAIQELCRSHKLVIHPQDPSPSWSTSQEDGEHINESLGLPPSWPSPQEASKGVQVELEAQFMSSSNPPRSTGAACIKNDAQVAHRVQI